MSKQSVYIVCPVRSGSTLLNMLLGSLDGIAAIGESFRVNSPEGHPDRTCTCGDAVVECGFWQPVRDKLRSRGILGKDQELHDVPVTERLEIEVAQNAARLNVVNPRRSFVKEAGLVFGSRTIWRALSFISSSVEASRRSAKNTHMLFDAVRETSSVSVIVDSSKNVGRMKSLYLERPDQTRVIFLLRDGRASCFSMMRAEEEPMSVCVNEWFREHKRIGWAMKSLPQSCSLTVRYEDICRNADGALNRICNWLGVPFKRKGNFRDNAHNIGGNPMRMRPNETYVKFDEKWRTTLSEDDLRVFNSVGGDLNKRLGYL